MNSPIKLTKQKLSTSAAKKKAVRDLLAAKSTKRKAHKADSQAKRRKAVKSGKNIKGKDYDHKDGKFKTVAANRGNDGGGTRQEGKRNYKIKK
jgi:hypothetical protein|tara:strand:- start:217 stop:495 length:279 start_codon:yes stop_codon:yes gene_type:complete